MTNSFTPSSPRYILDPFFTRHIPAEHSDTKFFQHFSDQQNRRKLTLFETTLCLSNTFLQDLGTAAFRLAAQHNIHINGHLNGLIGETMN